MKRYRNSRFNHDKYRAKQRHYEHKAGGFKCTHCKQFVIINVHIGTANRNHCNMCLWSKHVDEIKGDRKATCKGGMEPIGLTFKHDGYDRIGEIMLIHLCSMCQKVSINRIARDDSENNIIDIFKKSLKLEVETLYRLSKAGIYILLEKDSEILNIQLFGTR